MTETLLMKLVGLLLALVGLSLGRQAASRANALERIHDACTALALLTLGSMLVFREPTGPYPFPVLVLGLAFLVASVVTSAVEIVKELRSNERNAAR